MQQEEMRSQNPNENYLTKEVNEMKKIVIMNKYGVQVKMTDSRKGAEKIIREERNSN